MFAVRRIISRPFLGAAARQLQARPRRLASTGPPNIAEMMYRDPKLRDTFEKLSRHPGAITAMQNISQIIQSKGEHSLSVVLDLARLSSNFQNVGCELGLSLFVLCAVLQTLE